MKEKVSVIIPVYNVEKYIKKCLDSILRQTYQNLEIILVNDGSVDKSPEICDEYSRKDSRIKVFHKKNGGVSKARNFGLGIATGKYVCFMDSDDWMAPTGIEMLAAQMERAEADICTGKILLVKAVRNQVYKPMRNLECTRNDVKTYIEFIHQLEWGPCAKLYKKSLIEEYSLRFNEKVKAGEDSIFLTQYLQKCEKMASVYDVIYFYNKLNENSATTKCYEEYSTWRSLWADEYPKLFIGESREEIEEVENYYVKSCDKACWHYRNEAPEIAEKKMQEACELFSERISSINGLALNNTQEREHWMVIAEAIKNGNYYDLYLYYLKRRDMAKGGSGTEFLRLIVKKVKLIYYYKIRHRGR